MKMQTQVFGVTRFHDTEKNKFYSSVYLPEEKISKESDRMGSIPMKVACSFELMDEIRSLNLPCRCEVDFDISTGGGNKGSIFVNSITALK